MEEMENVLLLEDYRRNILELECLILHNDQEIIPLLPQIPIKTILSSSLISKAYGELLLKDGRLQEGLQYLSTSIKGLAAQGLQKQMLEAMACVALIHLRTGNLANARTILVFLQEEYQRAQSDQIGVIAYALAKGVHLLDAPNRKCEYIQTALQHYSIHQRFSEYAELLLNVWSGMVLRDECSQWLHHVVWMEQQVKLGNLPTSYIHFIRGLHCFYDSKWQDAIQHLSQIKNEEISYFHSAFAQVHLFRARCRDIVAMKTIKVDDVHEIEQLLKQYEIDLELQFYVDIVKFEWNLLMHDLPSAEQAKQRAEAIYQLTLFPYQSRELESLDEYSSMIRRSPSDSTNNTIDKHKVHTGSKGIVNSTNIEPSKTPSWRIYCFGKMQMMHNGQIVEHIRWKRKKTQELFIYLLFQQKYEAPRDRVIEVLFGDNDVPERLANRLYVTIHELRQVAMNYFNVQNAVIVKEGMIRLNEAMIEYVDVEQYRTLIRVGEQLWRKDRDLALEMFEQAVQLYGDLLPEVSYCDWLDQLREQLVELQCVILQRLTQYSIAEKQYDQAEWYIIQWLRLRPLQEEAHYAMLHLLLLLGRRSEARHRYLVWEKVCREELGIAPSREIRGLILENVK